MPIELSEEGASPIELCQTLPAAMLQRDIRGSVPHFCKGEKFQLLFQEFRGQGFSAWYNRFWVQQPSDIRARADLRILELRIGWSRQLHGSWERVPQLSLKPREFSLSYIPYVDTGAIFNANQYCATFDIHVERSLLEEMGVEIKALDEFWSKVEKEQPAELTPYPQSCTAAMLDCVQFILQNPYSMGAQPRLLEWNTKQILLMALETVANPKRPLPFNLTPLEIEGLHAVKQFISDSFPNWPSHTQLCRRAGINEFKLKAGFKHLFKMTTYDYHMLLKFKEAKKLLLEKKESITAIAYQIGYDHHASFTQEFKKQFGYTPSWFQKHGRL